MTTVLATDGLTKEFGSFRAVDTVSVAFDADDITSIIGPNGAGKTTFHNLLTGRLMPTAGTVELRADDRLIDITNRSMHEIATLGLSRAFQINNLFDQLSVLDNVRAARLSVENRTYDLWTVLDDDDALRKRAWTVLERTNLASVAHEPVANLSHGDKRKTEIALALATDPSVVLLDEPTAGMNPSGSEQMVEMITRLDEETDTTFILTEHDMDIVSRISDRIVVLARGSVIADGDPAVVMNDEDVAEAYLGDNA